MKRFSLALFFCASLLAGLSLFLFPTTRAAENPLLVLLNLPAPPPNNPEVLLPSTDRPENFYSKKNPPPDDAPIDVLMDYWREQSARSNELGYKFYPSDKVLDRLFAEFEKEPSKASEFLNIFPPDDRSIRFVQSLYDKSAKPRSEYDYEGPGALKRWLTYNSDHYSGDLARLAARVQDIDDYVSNHRELVALSRVDWNRAQPIVNRLYNNPGSPASRSAALWALYVHALVDGPPSDVDRYRDELKDVVADKSLAHGVRDLALDALSLEKEWSGRDEWYMSMMEDETLGDLGRFTGLTTLISSSPEDKYIDRMLGFLESDNTSVRSAAAQNLMMRIDSDPRILKALLPWLQDPKWVKSTQRGSREMLIGALARQKMPDAVPLLILALDEKSVAPKSASNSNAKAFTVRSRPIDSADYANLAAAAANIAANAASGYAREMREYPLREAAIRALAFQADPRAAPALRRILGEVTTDYPYAPLIEAVYKCGGFPISEQVAAVEEAAQSTGDDDSEVRYGDIDSSPTSYRYSNANLAVARAVNSAAWAANAAAYGAGKKLTADEIRVQLGQLLVDAEDVGEQLPRAVIQRIASMEKSDPVMATNLRKIVMRWDGTAVNSLFLSDLRSGRIEADAVVRLLAVRSELREKQSDEVSALRTAGPAALGISACLHEDSNSYDAILDGTSDAAKTAVLACGRLIRAAMPVQKVARNLRSPDKLLALAAERYLESEDSPEARQIVLSLHPNEAKILGARKAFFAQNEAAPESMYLEQLFATVSPYHALSREYGSELAVDSNLSRRELTLQESFKNDVTLLGIYSWRANTIRIYKDRAVLSWEKDPARYQERTLTPEEFEQMKGLIAHFKADDLPPFLACAEESCDSEEFVMVGRNGGRRLYVTASSMPPFFAELDKIFEHFRQPPSTVKYWASANVPGLEVLFADDRTRVMAAWKHGGDFRVLTHSQDRQEQMEAEFEKFREDAEAEGAAVLPVRDNPMFKEIMRRRYEAFSWNQFADGVLGASVPQPEQFEIIQSTDDLPVQPDTPRWKARAGAVEIRNDMQGLYKIVAGKMTKIADGHYRNPVITPDGRWVVVTKFGSDTGLVRFNLTTNREYPVKSGDLAIFQAFAFLPEFNRIIVGLPREWDVRGVLDASGAEGQAAAVLLDPATGNLAPIRGEVRPLIEQDFRPLQQVAGRPSEYWAALPKGDATMIGIYSARTFAFQPLMTLPKIRFNSMNIWADEPGGKIYIVYEGQLLSAPIKPKP